jgi:8-oxo-dGTP diphosphatase
VRKSSKLFAAKQGRLLLVRRKKDGAWALPGGKRKKAKEPAKRCLHRELQEELPALQITRTALWRKLTREHPLTGRKKTHDVFVARKVRGPLTIGDWREIDRAEWRIPRGLRLTRSARVVSEALLCRLRKRRN